MDLQLNGLKVLVTGASKGIGFAIAEAFVKEGAEVTLVSRSQDNLNVAADKIYEKHSIKVKTLVADLSKQDAVKTLVDHASDADILINNAGAIPGGDIEAIDEATWREAWDLKVYGYINMTRAYYDLMKKKPSGGVIINITGAAGSKVIYDYVAGSVANASLEAFSKTVGSYSLDHGVRILAISPGAIQTDRIIKLMRSSAKNQFNDEERWPELLSNMPAGRAGTPEEVANLTLFLASNKAAYISGAVYLIDGGFSARNKL